MTEELQNDDPFEGIRGESPADDCGCVEGQTDAIDVGSVTVRVTVTCCEDNPEGCPTPTCIANQTCGADCGFINSSQIHKGWGLRKTISHYLLFLKRTA